MLLKLKMFTVTKIHSSITYTYKQNMLSAKSCATKTISKNETPVSENRNTTNYEHKNSTPETYNETRWTKHWKQTTEKSAVQRPPYKQNPLENTWKHVWKPLPTHLKTGKDILKDMLRANRKQYACWADGRSRNKIHWKRMAGKNANGDKYN